MPRANRIAFVCPRFAEHGTVGGAETLLKALAERAAADGRQVDFLTTCATNHFTWENTVPPGTRTFGGLNVTFFPVDADRNVAAFLNLQDAIDKRRALSRSDEEAWIGHSVNSRALMAHLRENRDHYDRIITGPYLFGVAYHAALVAPEKTLLVPCLHDEPFAYLSIMRDVFHRVGGILFNIEAEQQLADRLYDLNGKGAVVGMGIEDRGADPRAFARRRGLDRPYVAYCGRREPLKGTPILLDYLHAFRSRTGRDVGLVLTGSGAYEAPEALLPAVLDLGFVDEQEKREVMAGATCFIHPSLMESFGIVLLEAWLAGAPALVHAKGVVLREQCRRSGGGLWFRHYPDFEEALIRLLDDPALRQRLGDAGRRYVLDVYAWPAVERRLFAALDGGAE
ncbi:MAG TPA: glycosyltransferase family 4 protein [Kiritimatiellia bacterium]|nr:glycosyltransferase family 4 protein [Kiritimatiellia bacterium]HMO99193.1 glycosyltransferase family 4 protein [Kiritimatiellia bacterium]HMP95780.1 glycosyltransferase family 4 protein [Kiritimatiellia bacterium]